MAPIGEKIKSYRLLKNMTQKNFLNLLVYTKLLSVSMRQTNIHPK